MKHLLFDGKSFWELACDKLDAHGDGTVPHLSGGAPRTAAMASVAKQFGIAGIAHEAAYKNATSRQIAYYAITKLARPAVVE